MVFGARDYIVKPVETNRLREAVNTVLLQEERRHLRRSGQLLAGGRGAVITVTGAKGGIGKTVVSVNLALALRQETGRSVVILDADRHFGDVATMLDLTPSRTLADVLVALGRLDRQTIYDFLAEHPTGVEVLAAPPDNEVWAHCDDLSLRRIIDLLAQTFDFVVIDTEGSFDTYVRACIEASTLTLVITTGEVSSIRDTAAALRRLEAWQIDPARVKVLLNYGARVNGFRMDDLKAAINREIFWQVPYDRRVPVSVQLGQPVLLARKSAAAQNLAALARLVAGTKKSLVKPSEGRSLWKRLLRRERRGP